MALHEVSGVTNTTVDLLVASERWELASRCCTTSSRCKSKSVGGLARSVHTNQMITVRTWYNGGFDFRLPIPLDTASIWPKI